MASNNWPISMPYDEIEIYDQSKYVEEEVQVDVNTVPSYPIGFFPLISPTGYSDDEKLVYLDSSTIGKYGNPDYFKYGLSLYCAKQFIDGGGHVLGLRMKAKNATHAHVGFGAQIKMMQKPLLKKIVDETDLNGIVSYTPYYKSVSDERVITFDDALEFVHAHVDDDGTPVAESVVIKKDATYVNSAGETVNFADVFQIGASTGTTPTTPTDPEDTEEVASLSDGITVGYDIYPVGGTDPVYKMMYKRAFVTTMVTKYFPTSEFTNGCDKDILKKKFEAWNEVDGVPCEPIPKLADSNYFDLEKLEEDKDYLLPLFMLYVKPSGRNNYRLNIEIDGTMESYALTQNDPQRFYKLTIYDGNTRVEPVMSFTFSDYIYGDQSMFIEDVIEEHCQNVGIIVAQPDLPTDDYQYSNNFDVLRDILSIYSTGEDLFMRDATSADAIDILFGAPRDNSEYTYFESGVGVNFSDLIMFANGSLGDFESKNTAVRNAAIKQALIDAYTGKTTDLIFDEVRYPFTFVIPYNTDSEVYNAINSLVNIRRSSVAPLYISPSSTYSEARAKRTRGVAGSGEDYTSFNDSKIMFHVESAMIKDPYTHKRIRMPAAYFNSKAIPRAITEHGYGTPFAGTKFYWDGFITGTMLPQTTNSDELKANHTAGLNTMIEDGQGRAYAEEQITTQNFVSSLSEINNSITLRIMANIALCIAKNTRWTTITDEEIATYKSAVESKITNMLNGAYKTLHVESEKESVNGVGRSRIHCKIYVSFNDLLKGVTYSIYVI